MLPCDADQAALLLEGGEEVVTISVGQDSEPGQLLIRLSVRKRTQHVR